MAIDRLDEFASDCLATLRDDHAELIRRRYGLQGHDEETLESIGSSAPSPITREGVRQRQLTVLKQLSREFSEQASTLVAAHIDLVWEQAIDGVMLNHSRPPTVPMPPAYQLAWHVTTGTIRNPVEWLEQWAVLHGRCWIDRRLEGFGEDVARVGDAAADLLPALRKPWAIRAISAQLDIKGEWLRPLLSAAFPKRQWNVYRGYIFEGKNSRRPRRAANLHALLKHGVDTDVLDLRQIRSLYVQALPNDTCSERDLLIVARDNKHLFLEVGSGYLSAIGIAADSSTFQETPLPEDEEGDTTPAEHEDPEGSSTVAARIAAFLREHGPQRLGSILHGLDMGKGTISGTIGQNAQFVRVLPGVYCLDELVDSIDLVADADQLFNEEEVLRIYVRARCAGEPYDLFPLWGPLFEYQLTLWADRTGSPQLPTLLRIAHPEEWPASDAVIQSWQNRKQQEQEDIVPPDFSIGKKLPDPRHVLAALKLAIDRQQASVVSCNLVLAADGLDSTVGCSLLMLLVASGCVEPGPSWIAPHPVLAPALIWADRLDEDLANHGKLNWSSPSASAFLAATRDATRSTAATWFDNDALKQVLEKLPGTPFTAAVPATSQVLLVESPPASIPVSTPMQTETETPKDGALPSETTDQLRERARAKDPDAMYHLALRTRIGDGTPASPVMAMHWLMLAARYGHLAATQEMKQILNQSDA